MVWPWYRCSIHIHPRRRAINFGGDAYLGSLLDISGSININREKVPLMVETCTKSTHTDFQRYNVVTENWPNSLKDKLHWEEQQFRSKQQIEHQQINQSAPVGCVIICCAFKDTKGRDRELCLSTCLHWIWLESRVFCDEGNMQIALCEISPHWLIHCE